MGIILPVIEIVKRSVLAGNEAKNGAKQKSKNPNPDTPKSVPRPSGSGVPMPKHRNKGTPHTVPARRDQGAAWTCRAGWPKFSRIELGAVIRRSLYFRYPVFYFPSLIVRAPDVMNVVMTGEGPAAFWRKTPLPLRERVG